jgi:hypothetical protein
MEDLGPIRGGEHDVEWRDRRIRIPFLYAWMAYVPWRNSSATGTRMYVVLCLFVSILRTTQWTTTLVAHLGCSPYLHYSIDANEIKQVNTRFLLLVHFCTILITHLMRCVFVRPHRYRSFPALG